MTNSDINSDGVHVPVLLNEVLAQLDPVAGRVVLDGTFGGGGYARAILDRGAAVWAIDRDPEAIARGETMVSDYAGRLSLIHGGFGDMLALLRDRGVERLDGAVFDLGVSSFQLDDPARGFSFRADGPLDMRMGSEGPSAADLVNALPEGALADVLYQFGEERLSRRIAKVIVAARQIAPIETTFQLATLIRKVVPKDKSGIDPATRSFQALRIQVNDELGHISRALEAATSLLVDGGRLVVVSFHSLEDRIVKQFMASACGRGGAVSRHGPAALTQAEKPKFRLLTSRACRPSDEECRRNPRARSAKLRAMERISPADFGAFDGAETESEKDLRFDGAQDRFRTGETHSFQREEIAPMQELAA